MPKTKADKYQVGLEYINDLSEDHQGKSFHGGATGCECICMQKDLIDSIKTSFQAEIKAFWDKPEHVAVCQEVKKLESCLVITFIHIVLWILKDQDTFSLLERKK